MQIPHRFQRFKTDENGNVGIAFGLTTFVVLAMVGGAIDFGRAIAMRDVLQFSTDSVAINGAATDSTSSNNQLSEARESSLQRARELGAQSVVITTRWLNDTDYEVLADAVMQTNFLSAVPGSFDTLDVKTRSVARSHRLKLVAGPPTKVDLSYEAADYNQVWVYCYDKSWQQNGTRTSDEGTSKTNPTGNLAFTKDVAIRENRYGRSDFTIIADNGGSTFTFSMPSCKENETISYMLFNSRNNRTSPSNWKKNNASCGTSLSQTGKACYTWYTDTKLDGNSVEQHSGTSPYQLETVLCENSTCTQLTESGTYIPGNNQRNRVPQKVGKKCETGKFMYFGWEDRPPQNTGGNGTGNPYAAGQSDPGGDRDYDDIRLIVSCPKYEKDSLNVRLIH